MAVVTARSVLKRRNVASLLLGCAVTIMLTCWVVDLLSVFQMMPNRIFTARLSYSAMLVAIGAGLTWRFARALNQVDGFAGRLVTQVREAEEKLKASFIREEERARAAALARERTRLMRDLHDGLGGQLVSIVALSERGNAGAAIGDAARAALKDLRLVIDSMDDIGGDLMLALGSWRERAMAQLRPHDIALEWRAVTPQGLPVHPELRPWHVIQIVRLLDEALTNAVKHANARRITVRIETLADTTASIVAASPSKTTARDLTSPRRTDPPGRRKRRAACATCEAAPRVAARSWYWTPAPGTRVRLTLPHRFPDSEAATLPHRVFPNSDAARRLRKRFALPAADAIDRAAAIHRRAGANTDAAGADADARDADTGDTPTAGVTTAAAATGVRPHHAALRHAGRLAVNHRGLGRTCAAQRERRHSGKRRQGQTRAQPSCFLQHVISPIWRAALRCTDRSPQPT